jgi:hypothetical protein
MKIPGPQAYSIPSKLIEGPTYIIGARTNDLTRKRDSLPGPGQYELLSMEKV